MLVVILRIETKIKRAEDRVEQRYRGRLVERDREDTRFMDESVVYIICTEMRRNKAKV